MFRTTLHAIKDIARDVRTYSTAWVYVSRTRPYYIDMHFIRHTPAHGAMDRFSLYNTARSSIYTYLHWQQ